ncbi:hypothetical protein M9458_017202, partial [Cirrhinus mrigala]
IGRKWSASRALVEAEDRQQHADIIGTVVQGRLGLGCFTRMSWSKAKPKELRSTAGHLDHGRTLDKVLDVFCLRCPAYSIEPPYLGMAESPSCTLCGKQANLEHILSACQSSQ